MANFKRLLENERRRLDRAAKRYDKQAAEAESGSITQAFYQRRAEEARQERSKYLYKNIVKGSKTAEERESKVRDVLSDSTTASFLAGAEKRANVIAANRLKGGYTKTADGEGSATGSFIYAAFNQMFIDESVPPSERNAFIMEKLGVANMEEALEKFQQLTGVAGDETTYKNPEWAKYSAGELKDVQRSLSNALSK